MDELSEWNVEPTEETTSAPPESPLDRRTLWEPIGTLRPRAPVTIPPTATVRDAIASLREHGIGCLLVATGERLVGILTERDLLVKLDAAALDGPVSDLMTPEPETIRPDDPIVFALNKMSVGGFRHVPLVDEAGHPVGVVSVKDVVTFVAELFARDVLNVPPEPSQASWRGRDGA